ncbi:MAG TPA: type II toxin-antitoxin system prevent-host-death family antitoxin [Allosphingosinicella sp.]|nr:type II toxin-antitoxin system prevent-host-death family antitoxin [Allosphingosinicella sp.]
MAVGGVLVVAHLAVAVRRLHDHDKTGRFYLLAFVPLIGWLFALFMMLTPGTEGENSYGCDPCYGDEPPPRMSRRSFPETPGKGIGAMALNLAKRLAKFPPMTSVSVHEAKTHLSRLLKQVEAGEEVVIMRNKEPVARIVRETPAEKKPLLGAFKGQFTLDERFFEPLPDDELALWNGEGD